MGSSTLCGRGSICSFMRVGSTGLPACARAVKAGRDPDIRKVCASSFMSCMALLDDSRQRACSTVVEALVVEAAAPVALLQAF